MQSFEVSNLQHIRRRSTVKIFQLITAQSVDRKGDLLYNGVDYSQPFDFVVSGDHRTYGDLVTDKGLNFVKSYAQGVTVSKNYIVSYIPNHINGDGKVHDLNGDGIIDSKDYIALVPSDLVKRAHKVGLLVHVFIFSDDSSTLLSNYNGDPNAEYYEFFREGVDAVLSNSANTALAARDQFAKST